MILKELPIIITAPNERFEQTKGIFTPNAEAIVENVPLEALSKNLNSVCGGVCEALSNLTAVGDFALKEVSIQVEISAQGGVNLIGTANVGGKGAITLKFEK